MTKAKQTDKFDRIIDFLNAHIFSFQQCMLEDKQNIDLYRDIVKILEKKSRGERIITSDYKALASISCPNEAISELFFQLTDQYTPDYYSFTNNWPNIECSECWKKYLECVTENINKADSDIKRFVPDIVNKRFQKLETLYTDSEEEKGGHA